VEYVIYCRKSTDDSSGKQVQSIPDQIRACMRYAEQNNIVIKRKPENFSFESEKELNDEDKCSDIDDRRVYQETRHYYIIKEQKSAKIPGERPKWKTLMSMVKQGKIRGILSYSPDRQARNMLE